MPSNDDARAAIRALRNGRDPMEQMGGKDGRPDLQDVVRLLDERDQAAKEGLMAGAALEMRGAAPVLIMGKGRSINPGIGGEIGVRWPNGFGLGVGGRSSTDNEVGPYSVDAEYAGVTPSYQVGNPEGAWGEAGASLGAMHYKATPQAAIQQQLAPYGMSLSTDERTIPMVIPRLGIGYGPASIEGLLVPAFDGRVKPAVAIQAGVRKRF